eukprot:TRINITY_DN2719_c0_g1_i2.p1 TRINITY_DN2719_c0_g1~~TRINITY_DN2719_c0_g1_i2.p1  ORF type:complete len:811 (+),score=182.40 TRINITY_DN2719_c0_g1_i2:282-2435(+)
MKDRKRVFAVEFNEDIGFWRWLHDLNGIVLVTAGAVFQMTAREPQPVKLFDRPSAFDAARITDCVTHAASGTAFLLAHPPNPAGTGALYLYSLRRNVGQLFAADAACYGSFRSALTLHHAHILAFVTRATGGAPAKLFVVEIPSDETASLPAHSRFQRVAVALPTTEENDVPIAVRIIDFGFLAVITRFGFLLLCDCETGQCVFKTAVSSTGGDMVLCSPYSFVDVVDRNETGMLVVVDSEGTAQSISFDIAALMHTAATHISSTTDPSLAARIALRTHFPGCENIVLTHVDRCLASGKITDAARFVADGPASLRTSQFGVLAKFTAATPLPNQPSPLLQYVAVLFSRQLQLTEEESFAICMPALALRNITLVNKWISENRLSPSVPLIEQFHNFPEILIPESWPKVAKVGSEEWAIQQGRRLLENNDDSLWVSQLAETNVHRAVIVAALSGHLLPAWTDAEQTSGAIKAFMNVGLNLELFAALENILLKSSSPFRGNMGLENLLLLLALKLDHARVMELAKALSAYDGREMGSIAQSIGLYEEAVVIYERGKAPEQAMMVLIEHMNDTQRAQDIAQRADTAECWAVLEDIAGSMERRAAEQARKVSVSGTCPFPPPLAGPSSSASREAAPTAAPRRWCDGPCTGCGHRHRSSSGAHESEAKSDGTGFSFGSQKSLGCSSGVSAARRSHPLAHYWPIIQRHSSRAEIEGSVSVVQAR